MAHIGLQICVWFTIAMGTSAQDTKVITTPSGQLRGLVSKANTTAVYQFRSIPYAKPPVNALRFAKPEAYGSWTGIRDATKFGPACMQEVVESMDMTMSEDCLVLNVYAPQDVSGKRAVMVWIHGGGYIKGDSAKFDASYLATRGDVVVVTINYRLGVLGFLSTNDTVMPGNNGLRDQTLALKWLQTNIGAFGGDPTSVTIFGESAGGFSVGLQAIIPQNKGLFQRAIAQSGAAPSFVSIAHHPVAFAQRFGLRAGCPFDPKNPSAFSICLKAKTAVELIDAQIVASRPFTLTPFEFNPVLSPVVDGDLLPDVPLALLKNKLSTSYNFFRSLDFMAGNVNREGSLFINKYLYNFSQIFRFDMDKGVPNNIVCDVLAPAVVTAFFKGIVKNTTIEKEICDEYKDVNMEVEGNKMADLYGDAFFVVPSVIALDVHSEGDTILMHNTFQYIFNRRNPAMKGNGPYPNWFKGAPHASENIFLFGMQQLAHRTNVSAADLNLSRDMQEYWTSFAKTGRPYSEDPSEWPHYDKAKRTYLNLDDVISTKEHVFSDRVSFWTETVPIY